MGVRRHGSEWVSAGGCTCPYGYGGHTCQRAHPVTENHPYTGRYFSGLYAPTGVSEYFVEEDFYIQLQMMVVSCSKRDTLIVLGDFDGITGNEIAVSRVLVLTALD